MWAHAYKRGVIMAATKPKLTKRQALVMAFIAERIDACGYPPTIREIGRAFGITSTNGVADHIKALAKKGYVTHEEGKSRTLRLTRQDTGEWAKAANDKEVGGHGSNVIAMQRPTSPGHKPLEPSAQPSRCRAVPLLGKVAAGEPILAVADIAAEDYLFVDENWLGQNDDIFALAVAGDSMIEAGIFNGDTVFVRRRDYAQAGETAVVLIDNEATIKRYHPEEGRLRLQPANAAMAPIYVYPSASHTVRVLGLVVGVYRRL